MEQDWSDLEPIYQKDMGENVIVIHCTDECSALYPTTGHDVFMCACG